MPANPTRAEMVSLISQSIFILRTTVRRGADAPAAWHWAGLRLTARGFMAA